jgi:hypothetical protein
MFVDWKALHITKDLKTALRELRIKPNLHHRFASQNIILIGSGDLDAISQDSVLWHYSL